MILTRAESLAVRRAVAAYRATRHRTAKGPYQGPTADEILQELRPTRSRWFALAALVIARADEEPGRHAP